LESNLETWAIELVKITLLGILGLELVLSVRESVGYISVPWFHGVSQVSVFY